MRGVGRILFGAVLVGGLVLVAGSAAGAQTRASRPAVALGDPVGTNVSPHGGYSASTGMCMQCHSVHGANSPFGMFRKFTGNSPTDISSYADGVCKTCHNVDKQAPAGKGNGFGPTGYVAGTTATRAAYQNLSPAASHTRGSSSSSVATLTRSGYTNGSVPATDSTEANGAGAGTSGNGDGTWTGGLYCSSCHTAHGDSGQLVNNWQSPANDDAAVSWNAFGTTTWKSGFLHKGTDGIWEGCTATGGGGTCEDLVVNSGQGTEAYLYGYKLLAASPNHAYGATQPWGATRPKTFNATTNATDVMSWCQTCHQSKSETKVVSGVRVLDSTKHMHPTGCTACHGNPYTLPVGGVADFPHTSTNADFLKDYPDALCLSCHTSGSLP
jgi:hypothetical protein